MERSTKDLYEHYAALPTEAEKLEFYRELSREDRLRLGVRELEINMPRVIRENQAREDAAFRAQLQKIPTDATRAKPTT